MSDLPEHGGETPQTNAPEISVSELANALKRTIEDRFGRVRVRGEISNYRGPHASGHAYFSLKDQSARLDAVIWKSTFTRLRTRPQEGLEVVATGRITTFPGKSSYQFVIESLEPAGLGALMALLDTRRKALAATMLAGALTVSTRPHGAVGDAAVRANGAMAMMAASRLGRLGPRMPLIHGIRSVSAWPRKPPRHRARRGGGWRN